MNEVTSLMVELGTKAPFFDLPAWNGERFSLNTFSKAPALLIIFICNQCPYVKHIRKKLVKLITSYQKRGVAVVGINSSDADTYPEEGTNHMKDVALRYFYTFPYLIDQSQKVARVYQAVCTPDFFLFNKERKLVYHGQLDDSRPGNEIPVSGRDLRAALDGQLAGLPIPAVQKPSTGCSISWKNEQS